MKEERTFPGLVEEGRSFSAKAQGKGRE